MKIIVVGLGYFPYWKACLHTRYSQKPMISWFMEDIRQEWAAGVYRLSRLDKSVIIIERQIELAAWATGGLGPVLCMQ